MPYDSYGGWQPVDPYIAQKDPNAPLNTGRGWSGLGSLIGRGLHAMNPERVNPDYDPTKKAGVQEQGPTPGGKPMEPNTPFKKAGFWRAIAGDQSNKLNLDESLRSIDSARGDINMTKKYAQDSSRASALAASKEDLEDKKLSSKLLLQKKNAENRLVEAMNKATTQVERDTAQNTFNEMMANIKHQYDMERDAGNNTFKGQLAERVAGYKSAAAEKAADFTREMGMNKWNWTTAENKRKAQEALDRIEATGGQRRQTNAEHDLWSSGENDLNRENQRTIYGTSKPLDSSTVGRNVADAELARARAGKIQSDAAGGGLRELFGPRPMSFMDQLRTLTQKQFGLEPNGASAHGINAPAPMTGTNAPTLHGPNISTNAPMGAMGTNSSPVRNTIPPSYLPVAPTEQEVLDTINSFKDADPDQINNPPL